MESVILVANRGDLLCDFKEMMRQHFSEALFQSTSGQDEFAVELTRKDQLYFTYCGKVEGIGWEEDEMKFISSYFLTPPHVYRLDYRGIEFVKKALLIIANSPDYLIDNDCGTLLPGHAFAQKMQQSPTWYWFHDL